ncbi:gluconokinase [Pikeienuella sp. HZG-20]|uniref:gluconokinase n=1 Tax=Paludibacillus litoralis TaxID=3133267 RepID=UPI0030EB678A
MAGPRLICVMGVAGCGKSTLGAALGAALPAPFIEADAYHPAANIAKMTAGAPLTDEDRWPWLDALGAAAPAEGRAVIACSALRRVYRERLAAAAGEPVFFLHLAGEKAVIGARMAGRVGHFMPPALLDSQFATLEPPDPDEPHLALDAARPPDILIEIALKELT